MTFELTLNRLRERIFPLARFVHEFSASLDPPTMRDKISGFRFANPDHRHFCLLRSARIVSALNAGVHLARSGFSQEIGVLQRTIHEFSSQIEAVVILIERDGRIDGEMATFVQDYFADKTRGNGPTKRVNLSQKYINELIGAQLDSARDSTMPGWKPAKELHRNIAFIFSNYVHGRYPEAMDLYGGVPGRFHLNGMSGTPKDSENIQMLDSLITTGSLCLLRLVQGLKLQSLVERDMMLREWYQTLGRR